MVATGIGLDHARIDREALTLDEAGGHAGDDDALEDVTQDIAVAEAAEPIEREGRMVRDAVFEIEPAEPPVGRKDSPWSSRGASQKAAVDGQFRAHALGRAIEYLPQSQ